MTLKNISQYFEEITAYLGYNNLPLQQKIISNYIVLLIIPIVIYYLIFNVYTFNIKNKELALINQLDRQAVENVDGYIRDLMQLTIQPLYYPQILDTLKEPVRLTYDKSTILTDMVNRIAVSKKYIHSVFLFDVHGNMLTYCMINAQLVKPYNPINEKWFDECLSLNGSPLVSGSSWFENATEQIPKNMFVFSVSRTLKDLYSIRKVGIISIYSEITVLRDICSKIRSVKGEKILVLDSNGSIVYDVDETKIGKTIFDPKCGLVFLNKLDLKRQHNYTYVNRKRYLINSFEIGSAGWKLIRIIPENVLYTNARNIRSRLFFLIIGFTVLSLLLSISMAYGITKPLQKLTSTMNRVEKGDLSTRFHVKYHDEVGQLGQSFNNMVAEIDNLINDVYFTKMQEKETELNALQSQINPHFIYNTLESIRMMAKLNDDAETSDMLSILGKLLRYGISNKSQVVTVKQEIEHLQNYLFLQNQRFDNQFELEISIPEYFYSLPIIKLIFQPIVENAIYHGLETSDQKGKIDIKGYEVEKGICFEVQDNGVGMTPEQVEQLVERLKHSMTEGSHGLGLRNVNERIKLYYGDQYGIRVASEFGKGTLIRIELPDCERLKKTRTKEALKE